MLLLGLGLGLSLLPLVVVVVLPELELDLDLDLDLDLGPLGSPGVGEGSVAGQVVYQLLMMADHLLQVLSMLFTVSQAPHHCTHVRLVDSTK